MSDSMVELEPAPPMMGIAPFTRLTTCWATATSSASVIVELSPVVPSTRMPSVLLARWKSTRRSSASKSTSPLALKGVTRATMEPVRLRTLVDMMGSFRWMVRRRAGRAVGRRQATSRRFRLSSIATSRDIKNASRRAALLATDGMVPHPGKIAPLQISCRQSRGYSPQAHPRAAPDEGVRRTLPPLGSAPAGSPRIICARSSITC